MEKNHDTRVDMWNCFIERWIINDIGGLTWITPKILAKIKNRILNDDILWDFIYRYTGGYKSVYEFSIKNRNGFSRCADEFWYCIEKCAILEKGEIKCHKNLRM